MINALAASGFRERASAPPTVALVKGASIYHEGDPSTSWYEVVSGVVRTCRYRANGDRQLTGFYYADEAFGLDSEHYQESAESVTDVVLRRHPPPDDSNSSELDDVLAKALEKARQSIFLFGHRTATNRVAAFILAAAERAHAPGLELVMTRNDIADHLNLTLHTVSRTISYLARRKLIQLNGPQCVRIIELKGLKIVAGDADLCASRDAFLSNTADRQ